MEAKRRRVVLPLTDPSQLTEAEVEELISEQCRRIPVQPWEVESLLANCKRRKALDKGLAIVYEYAGYIDRIRQLLAKQQTLSQGATLLFAGHGVKFSHQYPQNSKMSEDDMCVNLFKSYMETNVEIACEVSSWRRMQWCPRPVLCSRAPREDQDHTQPGETYRQPPPGASTPATTPLAQRIPHSAASPPLSAIADHPPGKKKLTFQAQLRQQAQQLLTIMASSKEGVAHLKLLELSCPLHLAAFLAPCFTFEQAKGEFFQSMQSQALFFALEQVFIALRNIFFLEDGVATTYRSFHPKAAPKSEDVYYSFPMLRLVYPGYSFPTDQFKWFWDADSVYLASAEVLQLNLLGGRAGGNTGSPKWSSHRGGSFSDNPVSALPAPTSATAAELGAGRPEYQGEEVYPGGALPSRQQSLLQNPSNVSVSVGGSLVLESSLEDVSYNVEHALDAPIFPLSDSITGLLGQNPGGSNSVSDSFAESQELNGGGGGVWGDTRVISIQKHQQRYSDAKLEEEDDLPILTVDKDKIGKSRELAMLEALEEEKRRLDRFRQHEEELASLRALSEGKQQALESLVQERKRLEKLRKQEEAEKQQVEKEAADLKKAEKEKERLAAKLRKEQEVALARAEKLEKAAASGKVSTDPQVKGKGTGKSQKAPPAKPSVSSSSSSAPDRDREREQERENQVTSTSVGEEESTDLLLPQDPTSCPENLERAPRDPAVPVPAAITALPSQKQLSKLRDSELLVAGGGASPRQAPSPRQTSSPRILLSQSHSQIAHSQIAAAESVKAKEEMAAALKEVQAALVASQAQARSLEQELGDVKRTAGVSNTISSIVDEVVGKAVLKSQVKKKRKSKLLHNGAALTIQRFYRVLWSRPGVRANASASSHSLNPPDQERGGSPSRPAVAISSRSSTPARPAARATSPARSPHPRLAASSSTPNKPPLSPASKPQASTARPVSPQNLASSKFTHALIEASISKVLAPAGTSSRFTPIQGDPPAQRSTSQGQSSSGSISALPHLDGTPTTKPTGAKGVFTSSIGSINLNLAFNSRLTFFAQGLGKITDEKQRALVMGSKKIAAVLIQAKMRNFLARKRIKSKKNEIWETKRREKKDLEWSNPRTRTHAAATVLQKCIRGFWARKRICRLISAAMVLNTVYRRNVALIALRKSLRRIDRPLQIVIRGVRNLPSMVYDSTPSIKIKVYVYWAPLLHIITAADLKTVIQGKFPQFAVTTELKTLERVLTREEEEERDNLAKKRGNFIRQMTVKFGGGGMGAAAAEAAEEGNDDDSSSSDEEDEGEAQEGVPGVEGASLSAKIFKLPKLASKWTAVFSKLRSRMSKKLVQAIAMKPKRPPIPAHSKCVAVFGETIRVPACHGNSVIRFEVLDEADKKIGNTTFMLSQYGKLMFWKAEAQLPFTVMGVRRAVPEKLKGAIGGNADPEGPMLEVCVSSGAPKRSKCGWSKLKISGYGPIRSVLGQQDKIKNFLFEKWHRLYLSCDGETLSAYSHKSATTAIFLLETKNILSCVSVMGEFIEMDDGAARTAADDNYNVILTIQNSPETLTFRFGDSGSRVQWIEALSQIVEDNEKERNSEEHAASYMSDMFHGRAHSPSTKTLSRGLSSSSSSKSAPGSPSAIRNSFNLLGGDPAGSKSGEGSSKLAAIKQVTEAVSKSSLVGKASDLFASKQAIHQKQATRRSSAIGMQLSETLALQRGASVKGLLPGIDSNALAALQYKFDKKETPKM